ncbi:hypothetical protein ES708_21853 [subsurface metagenome]
MDGRLPTHLQHIAPEIDHTLFSERLFGTIQRIPVGNHRVGHAQSFGELDVWTEVRAGDVAHRDAEIIQYLSESRGEHGNQRLLGVAFDEYHAAGEEQLRSRGIEVVLEIVQLVGRHRQVGKGECLRRPVPSFQLDDRPQRRDRGERRGMAGDDQCLCGIRRSEQLLEDGPLQLRVKVRLRFLDAQQGEVALVLPPAPCEFGQLQRQQGDVG